MSIAEHVDSFCWRALDLQFSDTLGQGHHHPTVRPPVFRLDDEVCHRHQRWTFGLRKVSGGILYERMLSVAAPAKAKLVHDMLFLGCVPTSTTDVPLVDPHPACELFSIPTVGTVI